MLPSFVHLHHGTFGAPLITNLKGIADADSNPATGHAAQEATSRQPAPPECRATMAEPFTNASPRLLPSSMLRLNRPALPLRPTSGSTSSRRRRPAQQLMLSRTCLDQRLLIINTSQHPSSSCARQYAQQWLKPSLLQGMQRMHISRCSRPGGRRLYCSPGSCRRMPLLLLISRCRIRCA